MTNPTRTRLYKVVTPIRTRLIEAGSRASALLHAANSEILISLPEQHEVYILAKTGVEIEHASHAALSDDERLADIARRAQESAEKIRLHAALLAVKAQPDGLYSVVDLFNKAQELVEEEQAIKKEAVTKKPVSWSDMPVGVMTDSGILRGVTSDNYLVIEGERTRVSNYCHISDAKLAPADQQPWIAVQDGQTGYGVTQALHAKGIWTALHASGEKYRVIGIAEGWELT